VGWEVGVSAVENGCFLFFSRYTLAGRKNESVKQNKILKALVELFYFVKFVQGKKKRYAFVIYH